MKRCEEHEALGHRVIYDDRFDAYVCTTCNLWLESACNDLDCDYCAKRPKLPCPQRGE
jgi:hypothetical protein